MVLISALTGIVSISSPLRADLIGVNIFDNTTYEQTSGAAPVTPDHYFFDIGGNYANPGDFASAEGDFPSFNGISPLGLAINDSALNFNGGRGGYITLADLHMDFGFGTYDITAFESDGRTSQTGELNYIEDAFTADIPALTSGTWSTLNGLDPSTDATVAFNSFTPAVASTGPTQGLTFFTIYDHTTGRIVWSDGFLDPSTMSVELPADTLTSRTTYDFELDFSDRLVDFDRMDSVFTQQGFDVRTDGVFTTGDVITPEPRTFMLLGLGLLGFGVYVRRYPSSTCSD